MEDLKSELSRQYSAQPFNSHATQAFSHLQQGSNGLLEMYLHHASELLLKIHHMTEMSPIPAEDLSHYTMVCGLNSIHWKKR